MQADNRGQSGTYPINHEYHLIDLAVGLSKGGFETLAGARHQPVRKVCGLGISFTGMRGSSIMILVVLEQSSETSVFRGGYWRRRPETKAALPALFYVICLPTIGEWAASDWPAGVIHHLGWPHGGTNGGLLLHTSVRGRTSRHRER